VLGFVILVVLGRVGHGDRHGRGDRLLGVRVDQGMTTFRWIIYPSRTPELYAIADEFTVEGCRLRVGGNSIDVEADDEAKARDLASRYLALLQKRLPILGRVISEEEFSEFSAYPSRDALHNGTHRD